jgi:DNA polymerase-1
MSRIFVAEYDSFDDVLNACEEWSLSGRKGIPVFDEYRLYIEFTEYTPWGDDWFWSDVETDCQTKKDVMEDPKTQVIKTIKEFDQLVNFLTMLKSVPMCWDTESTGLDMWSDGIVGIGVCWGLKQEQSAYIPVGHWVGENIPFNYVIKKLRPILESEEYLKTFHNAKYDIKVLRLNGIHVKGLVFDTMIAHWLLHCREGVSHKIENCLDGYLHKTIKIPTYDDMIKMIPTKVKHKNLGDLEPKEIAYYCGLDCWNGLYLYNKLSQELEKQPLVKDVFYKIDLPNTYILTDMELRGLQLDLEWYEQQKIRLENEIFAFKVNAELYKPGLNISSAQQLNRYFFDELGLSTYGLTKNKTGYCLDKNALPLLKGKHPVCDIVLGYRSSVKTLGTYINGVLKRLNHRTGYLHTEYNMIGTVTGRLSSANPNSQNFSVEMREGIIARPGHVFLSIDYSGCEYRILTHLSKCKHMINEYLNGGDAHTAVCRLFFPTRDPKEKWKGSRNYRFFGKTLNFSIVYGQSESQTADATGMTVAEVQDLYAKYWRSLPEIKQFMIDTYKQAVAYGYTETIMGRRRYYSFTDEFYINQKGRHWKDVILKMPKDNHKDDAEVFRQAGNARIQGSNADITKMAMIETTKYIKENNLRTHLMLQIHDELMFEVPFEEIAFVVDPILNIMRNVIKLCIPLDVDHRVGLNWMEVKG